MLQDGRCETIKTDITARRDRFREKKNRGEKKKIQSTRSTCGDAFQFP